MESTNPPAAAQLCPMCNDLGSQLCTGCRCSRYCSAICQKDDWKVHKLLCKELQKYSIDSKPPRSDHYRAINFPVSGEKPYFTWLSLNFTPLDLVGLDECKHNDVLKRSHQHISMVQIRGTTRSGINKSLAAIDKELCQSTIGPLEGSYFFHGQLSHLDTMDFRHIIDWLRTDHYHVTIEHQRLVQNKDVRGVRINCRGDMKISDRPAFEAAHVPDSLFDIQDDPLCIAIAEKVGLPLVMRTLSYALPWRGRHIDTTGFFTQAHNLLFHEMNPTLWLMETGSILVARKDRKPLLPAHIEVLHLYCRWLGKVYGEPMPTENGDPERDVRPELDPKYQKQAEYMAGRASKEEFLKYWETHVKVHAGEYGDIASPYEM